MPKASPIQNAFTAGELSPGLAGRTDVEPYKKGLETCLNYIPTLQGPLIRRPGSKYLNNVKIATSSTVLIPFSYSATQNYVLEFGQQYIRFYANNGQVITNSNYFQVAGALYSELQMFYLAARPTLVQKPGEIITATSVVAAGTLELPTPYNAADVGQLRWSQNADTMYLTHPNYPVFKLQRYASNDWKLQQVYFQDGPYLPLNSYKTIGDSTTITLVTGSTGGITTLTTGPLYNCSSIIANSSGAFRITTNVANSYFNGQQIVVQNAVYSGSSILNTFSLANSSAPNAWTINVLSANTFDLVGSVVNSGFIYTGSGIVKPSLFTSVADTNRVVGLQVGAQRYWGTITSYLGDNSSVGFVFDPSVSIPTVNDIATFWNLGCFGGTCMLGGTLSMNGFAPNSNFPATSSFHQNRLVFAGSPNYPQQVDGSYVGQYENFAATVAIGSSAYTPTAANAFSYILNSQDQNALRWLKSTAQGLLAGSYSAEWNLTPGANADALSPTSFNAQQTSFFGTANVDAVQAGNATIYIQRAQKKVRELNYFFQVGTFRSTDMTELADHLTLPSIIKLSVQKETYPLIWAIRSDGNLVTMTYSRDDANVKAGWARHILGGQSDAGGTNPIVQSIATIPDPTTLFDQLWMVVSRSTASGSSYVAIEYLTRPFDDSSLQEDAFQLDCGATFDSPITITNISHASSAIVTAASHGLINNDQIRINNVVGLNKTTTDINGNVTKSNLVNGNTFVVGSAAVNTFNLLDFNGVPVASSAYGAYVSSGQVRKMVLTISGLNWLPGETVGVLADGGYHPDCVVSGSSSITLNYRAAKVQIGYRYNSDGKLMRPEAGAADGSSIGKTRRPTRAAVQLHRVGDFSMGTSFTDLVPLEIPRADNQLADQASPLFSGIHRDGLGAAYDFEGQVCFRQSSPLPGMVQSVTVMMEEQDV